MRSTAVHLFINNAITSSSQSILMFNVDAHSPTRRLRLNVQYDKACNFMQWKSSWSVRRKFRSFVS